MKKWFLLTFLSFLSFMPLAVAAKFACPVDANDPYAVAAKVPAGKYKGMCLDIKTKRSVQILENNSAYMVVTNFYHDNRWWTARVPKDGIKDTIFQIALFETSVPFIVAAHTQIRMIFDSQNPVVLVPQNLEDQKAGVSSLALTDVVYSVEYIAPPGVSYSLLKGQFNKLGIVGRFLSMKSRAAEELKGDSKEIIKQIPLDLSSSEKSAFLENAMLQSERMGLKEMYNTVQKNCTTELFTILDDSIKYSGRVQPFGIYIFDILNPIEKPSIKALTERRIIDKTRTLPTLNDELKKVPQACRTKLSDSVSYGKHVTFLKAVLPKEWNHNFV